MYIHIYHTQKKIDTNTHISITVTQKAEVGDLYKEEVSLGYSETLCQEEKAIQQWLECDDPNYNNELGVCRTHR